VLLVPATLDAAKVRADFKKAAADKKITRAEVRKIVSRARRNKLEESEANALKREAVRYKSSFTADGAKELTSFIKNKMRPLEVLDPGDHPDPIDVDDPPVLKADRDRLEQEVVKGGQLFRNGIKGTDPEQNYIGDCYFVGGMSAVAHANPLAIAKAFKKNKDGTFTVRLYDAHRKPHYV
jgi:hypothetical protein